jgi:hypothetical protein
VVTSQPLVRSSVVQRSVIAIELKSVVYIHVGMELSRHLRSAHCAVVGTECVMTFGLWPCSCVRLTGCCVPLVQEICISN